LRRAEPTGRDTSSNSLRRYFINRLSTLPISSKADACHQLQFRRNIMRTINATLAALILAFAWLTAGCGGSGLSKEQEAARSYLAKQHGPGEVVFVKWWSVVISLSAGIPEYLAASGKEIEKHLANGSSPRWASQRLVDQKLADAAGAKLVRVRIKCTKLGREMTLDRLVIVKGDEAVSDSPITELSGVAFREWIEKHFPSGS
jgi:hypothetical protein